MSDVPADRPTSARAALGGATRTDSPSDAPDAADEACITRTIEASEGANRPNERALPRIPPPPPRRLGPVEQAVATELRRHRGPLSWHALKRNLRDVPRRSLLHHVARLYDLGLVEIVTGDRGQAYRWRADAAPSVFDDLPLHTCPICCVRNRTPSPEPEQVTENEPVRNRTPDFGDAR
jgi:DNA-binding transcriptional ArsR family regulator